MRLSLLTVIPAKAGIHSASTEHESLDPGRARVAGRRESTNQGPKDTTP